jgi:serine/threonine-protein kinase SRK2
LDQRFLGAVDYEIPADKQVSDQLRDLLKRMLVADPHQRANLLEIEQHPWFRKDIPPDLNVGTFNANYLRLSDSAEHANTIRRQAF